jgi:hypothetical protein
MLYSIGIENNYQGRTLAWALEYPGCFAYGDNENQSLAAMPRAISDYAVWGETRSGVEGWLDVSNIELLVEESWDVYRIDEQFQISESGHEVNAWFRSDWKPLNVEEIKRALELLSWTRSDLLDAVTGLRTGELEVFHPGERWNIAGILKHVAMAEWWYLDRLGLSLERKDVPLDPFKRLEVVRAHLTDVLPTLADKEMVLGVDGEFWSPRKVVRRAIWHERDHTWHIHKLG